MNISFAARISKIGLYKIIRIPLKISRKLPSRGMVMIKGKINELSFISAVEPDGKGNHWFKVSDSLIEKLNMELDQKLRLDIESINNWPEPEVSKDILHAFNEGDVIDQWNLITTKARWDWIRSTNNPETRKKRIDITCSKLENDDKNPCCFDRSRCTVTDVSKSGVVID